MTELTQRIHERRGPEPTGLPDPFAQDDGLRGIVTVSRGIFEGHVPAGITVGEIRRRFADRFEIGAENRAFIDGQPVDDETVVVQSGERLEFMHKAGEKGR